MDKNLAVELLRLIDEKAGPFCEASLLNGNVYVGEKTSSYDKPFSQYANHVLRSATEYLIRNEYIKAWVIGPSIDGLNKDERGYEYWGTTESGREYLKSITTP